MHRDFFEGFGSRNCRLEVRPARLSHDLSRNRDGARSDQDLLGRLRKSGAAGRDGCRRIDCRLDPGRYNPVRGIHRFSHHCQSAGGLGPICPTRGLTMDTVVHICPVCGNRHGVHPVLHQLAYGRQLTCSPRCKDNLPRLVRARVLAEMAERRRALAAADETND